MHKWTTQHMEHPLAVRAKFGRRVQMKLRDGSIGDQMKAAATICKLMSADVASETAQALLSEECGHVPRAGTQDSTAWEQNILMDLASEEC